MGESRGERKSLLAERGSRRRNATRAMTLGKAISIRVKEIRERGSSLLYTTITRKKQCSGYGNWYINDTNGLWASLKNETIFEYRNLWWNVAISEKGVHEHRGSLEVESLTHLLG